MDTAPRLSGVQVEVKDWIQDWSSGESSSPWDEPAIFGFSRAPLSFGIVFGFGRNRFWFFVWKSLRRRDGMPAVTVNWCWICWTISAGRSSVFGRITRTSQ